MFGKQTTKDNQGALRPQLHSKVHLFYVPLTFFNCRWAPSAVNVAVTNRRWSKRNGPGTNGTSNWRVKARAVPHKRMLRVCTASKTMRLVGHCSSSGSVSCRSSHKKKPGLMYLQTSRGILVTRIQSRCVAIAIWKSSWSMRSPRIRRTMVIHCVLAAVELT